MLSIWNKILVPYYIFTRFLSLLDLRTVYDKLQNCLKKKAKLFKYQNGLP